MSAEAEAIDVDDTCCASCGIAANDDIKLKNCTACYLVKYCGVKCQKEHRPQHKRECKKRAAELRDEILFKQPESTHLGDCPICCLPLPLDGKASSLMACCSQQICKGCGYTNAIREINEKLVERCPFCRHPTPKTQEEAMTNLMSRVEANDTVALREFGTRCHSEGDHVSAIEQWTKAAKLGDADAHYQIFCVVKDTKKAINHAELAAIGGHPGARFYLGCEESRNGRYERAVKHWIIAANLGHDEALETLRKGYAVGSVSKDDFAAALRAHQAALDATKSLQRETAEAVLNKR
eukprot:scaffold2020_cov68-Skeletonema_dohrnii-CCMP3373.AAC.3